MISTWQRNWTYAWCSLLSRYLEGDQTPREAQILSAPDHPATLLSMQGFGVRSHQACFERFIYTVILLFRFTAMTFQFNKCSLSYSFKGAVAQWVTWRMVWTTYMNQPQNTDVMVLEGRHLIVTDVCRTETKTKQQWGSGWSHFSICSNIVR